MTPASFAPWEPPFRYDEDRDWICDKNGHRILKVRHCCLFQFHAPDGIEEPVLEQDTRARFAQQVAEILNIAASSVTIDEEAMKQRLVEHGQDPEEFMIQRAMELELFRHVTPKPE